MEAKRTIDAHLKTFLYFDPTNDLTAEFAKIWLKVKKGRTDMPPEITRLAAKPGFVGSGRWNYSYKGARFEVRGHANGKGFWGTDYIINREDA